MLTLLNLIKITEPKMQSRTRSPQKEEDELQENSITTANNENNATEEGKKRKKLLQPDTPADCW